MAASSIANVGGNIPAISDAYSSASANQRALTAASPPPAGAGSPSSISSADAFGHPSETSTTPPAMGSGTSADKSQRADAETTRRAGQPTGANGLQFVYVYDDQLHRNVVKIRNIETQKLSADTPSPIKPSADPVGQVGAVGGLEGTQTTGSSTNGPNDPSARNGSTGGLVDTTA
jgi:hypothetical protein